MATLAAGVLAAGASAQPAPESGDPRATAVAGNVDIGQPGNACEVVGLPGTEATMPEGTFTSDGTYIDITAFPPGTVVTGVVVKGGPAYNVYPAGNLGPLPWLDLHSPLSGSGKNPAAISHWFVCVDVPATTTTAPTTTMPTTITTAPTTTTAPTVTTTSPGVTTTTHPATTTTTTPAMATTTTTKHAGVGVPGSDDDLAATGFNALWLLIGGSALVATGGAVLLASKFRRRARR
ncbi:hypothetical protein ACRAKI_05610 [Saccharothrix isguenensis]